MCVEYVNVVFRLLGGRSMPRGVNLARSDTAGLLLGVKGGGSFHHLGVLGGGVATVAT